LHSDRISDAEGLEGSESVIVEPFGLRYSFELPLLCVTWQSEHGIR
jgi:hypothetical protein